MNVGRMEVTHLFIKVSIWMWNYIVFCNKWLIWMNIVEKKMLVVDQDEKWWASTDKKLGRIVNRYVALVNHESWQVRQTLVYCASALLQNCYKLVTLPLIKDSCIHLYLYLLHHLTLTLRITTIFKVPKCSI